MTEIACIWDTTTESRIVKQEEDILLSPVQFGISLENAKWQVHVVCGGEREEKTGPRTREIGGRDGAKKCQR